MKNLSKAIYAKLSGSDLYTDITGRMYKGRAPDETDYPYVVYFLISNVPDDTFAEDLEDVIIQFSLFSETESTTEVEDMYTHLKALYDDCSLTITGESLIYMVRRNAILAAEEHTTPSGTEWVWHYAVDYALKVKIG